MVTTISSCLHFGRPAPPWRGSASGRKFLAPPNYSQRAVFASLWALFFSFAFVKARLTHYEPCVNSTSTLLNITVSQFFTADTVDRSACTVQPLQWWVTLSACVLYRQSWCPVRKHRLNWYSRRQRVGAAAVKHHSEASSDGQIQITIRYEIVTNCKS